MARPRRNFYANGRMSPHYQQEQRIGAAIARGIGTAEAAEPRPTVEQLRDLAISRGLDAYIVPSHGRLMCAVPGRVYPTEIVTVADIDRLAAFLPPAEVR